MLQPTTLDALSAHDARLIVVSFAPRDRLQSWVPFFRQAILEQRYRDQGMPAPSNPFARVRFVSDPTRAAYHAYGLGRNSLLRVYGPRILWQYARWAIQRRPLRRTGEDTLQRGGDFVVGLAGRLTFAHTGRNQADRPPISAILRAL